MFIMFEYATKCSEILLTCAEPRRPHLLHMRVARPGPARIMRRLCDLDMVQSRNRNLLDVRWPDGLRSPQLGLETIH